MLYDMKKISPTRLPAKPVAAGELVDYLELCLKSGEYLPGSRLPSIRRLARQFQLSYNSAMRGVNYLCRQGLLVKSPQRGIFAAPGESGSPDDPRRRTIGVVLPTGVDDTDPGIFGTILTTMRKQARHYGVALQVFSCPRQPDVAALLREVTAVCGGIIFLIEIDSFVRHLQLEIPGVCILSENEGCDELSGIGIDPFAAAQKAIRYFRERGVARIQICSAGRPVYINRAKVFRYLWEEQFPGSATLFTVTEPERQPIDFSRDTGYFFTSDHCAYCYARLYAEKFHAPLADNHTVLAVDGKSLLMADWPSFPTIAVDWKMIGHMALEECLSRMRIPRRQPRRIYLFGRLVEPGKRRIAGKSVG